MAHKVCSGNNDCVFTADYCIGMKKTVFRITSKNGSYLTISEDKGTYSESVSCPTIVWGGKLKASTLAVAKSEVLMNVNHHIKHINNANKASLSALKYFQETIIESQQLKLFK